MPDVLINGPAGKLEGRYYQSPDETAPIAVVLHPHPLYGGAMNNKVVYNLFQLYRDRNFSVLRFNFRGVGRSDGTFNDGEGETADAAAALDWLQANHPSAAGCWLVGFSFGAWISLKLLARRPEISAFVAVAPPANMFDFKFLSAVSCAGLIVHGTHDDVVPPDGVNEFVGHLQRQKGMDVTHVLIPEADHFFAGRLGHLRESVNRYVDERLS